VRGKKAEKKWLKEFKNLNAETASEFSRLQRGDLPDFKPRLEELKQKIFFDKPKQPTRKSSGDVLEVLTKIIPELIGGSADLTGSVNTKTSSTKSISKNDFSGRYIHYGVREHAMAAVMNGIALHKGFVPYSGTFLVFSDYMKPAIRLSALMKQRVIYVLTHDSIGLGEDGPTHQPIEHLASLRAIPNLNVFRPADAEEVAGCFELALNNKETPSAMVLSRQNVGFYKTEYNQEDSCSFGGYAISDTALNIEPDVIIIATGSEVGIALEAKEQLHKHGLAVRVVSMPCVEIFEKQNIEYKNKILNPKSALKVVIEAGISQGWDRYLGDEGIFIGMNGFGASGKAEDLFKHFGITADAVTQTVITKLKK
jgi:transketolase